MMVDYVLIFQLGLIHALKSDERDTIVLILKMLLWHCSSSLPKFNMKLLSELQAGRYETPDGASVLAWILTLPYLWSFVLLWHLFILSRNWSSDTYWEEDRQVDWNIMVPEYLFRSCYFDNAYNHTLYKGQFFIANFSCYVISNVLCNNIFL